MRASAFEQDHVVPDFIDVAVALPPADFAETAGAVKRAAGEIAGHHLRLKRPIACRLGDVDEPVEQSGADALPLCLPCYVYADLSDAGSASGVGNRREGRPSGYLTAVTRARHQSADRQMA